MRIRTASATAALSVLAVVGGSTWGAPAANADVTGVKTYTKPSSARFVPVTVAGYLTPAMSARGPLPVQEVTILARYRSGWVVLATGETGRDRFAATVTIDTRAAGVSNGGTVPLWVETTDDIVRTVVTIRRPGC